MLRKKYFIILFLTQFYCQVSAQPSMKIGPEISLSYLAPQKADYCRKIELVNPGIGVSIDYHVSNLIVSSGIYFGKSSYKSTSQIPLHGMQPNKPAYLTQYSKTSFTKLKLPLTIGITNEKSKLQPRFVIGYQPNIILNGKFAHGWTKQSINLPQGFTSQIVFSFSINLFDELNVKTSYAKGGLIDGYEPERLMNDEFNLSVIYYFRLRAKTD